MHGLTDVLTTKDKLEGWVFAAVILGVTALLFAIL
jgi:hypothetical protein